MNLAKLLTENVSRFGEYPLIHFQGESITNTELDQLVNRVASGLSELGVKAGDRVTLVMGNSTYMVASMMACFKLGAWAMPVVLSLKTSELFLVLRDAEPTTVIAHRLFAESIMETVKNTSSLRYRIMAGRGPVPQGWRHWEDWIVGQTNVFESKDCEPEDVALLLYTSGTTGEPKGVMLSHMNLYANSINSAASQGLTQGEITLLGLPLNHSFGITAWLAALSYGMQVVLMKRFDPEEALGLIEKHEVESAAMVPTMLAFLLQAAKTGRFDTSSLHRIVVGGAPLSRRLRARFEQAFTEVEILEAYGLTEASPGVTVTRPGTQKRPGSVGQTVENQEICIMDSKDNPLPPGEVGEVCTRGPHVMQGYYMRPEETGAIIRNGWLHTGDAGYIDEEGHLYLTERLKDLIIRGGENVYPSDIERVIRQMNAVAEVSVIGVPDEVYGEQVAAVVVPKRDAKVTEQEIISLCRERLAPFQVPSQVIFAPILPKTPLGKVRKKDLRSQVSGAIGHGDEQ